MTTYVSPFTGQTLSPSQVGYESLLISSNTSLSWPINGTNTGVVANITEITATVSGLIVTLPPALQVSVGQAFIIKNLGTTGNFSFTLADNSGNTIISVPVASTTATVNTYYVYLTNNLTLNGTWSTIAMGIGSSSVSASALAGQGLKASGAVLNEVVYPFQVSSNYTFLNTDQSSLYVWTGGVGTLTLPSASAVGSGWFVFVKNDGTGICNVTAQGSSIIDNSSNTTQIQLGNSIGYATNGTNWFTFALGLASTFNYTQLALSITGGSTTLSNVQSQNVIQTYSGALTSNQTIVLPQTVQLYSLNNQTSGAFNLTFQTSYAGGLSLTLPQGQTIIAICDGKNVYSAQTATISTLNVLKLLNNTASLPSLTFQDVTTGLYAPSSGQIGFSISGALAAYLTASGFVCLTGISGGTF